MKTLLSNEKIFLNYLKIRNITLFFCIGIVLSVSIFKLYVEFPPTFIEVLQKTATSLLLLFIIFEIIFPPFFIEIIEENNAKYIKTKTLKFGRNIKFKKENIIPFNIEKEDMFFVSQSKGLISFFQTISFTIKKKTGVSIYSRKFNSIWINKKDFIKISNAN